MEASRVARDGFKDFVSGVMNAFHDEVRKGITKECSSCQTFQIVSCWRWCKNLRRGYCNFHGRFVNKADKRTVVKCPNKVCCKLIDAVTAQCLKSKEKWEPSWENTDCKKWYAEHWELAKCFLPFEGTLYKKDIDNTSWLGYMHLMKNCHFFYKYIAPEGLPVIFEVNNIIKSIS